MYSFGCSGRLGRNAVWQDTSDQLCVAILLVSDYFAVLEVDHEDIVVVVASTVAGQIFASSLQNYNIAAINYAGGDSRPFYESTIQWTEYFVNNGLLARELTAPRPITDGSPNNIIVARLPKGYAIAFGDLVEDVRDELGVGGKTTHWDFGR
jgi:hypothetical protein